MVATNPSPDLVLTPLNGPERTVGQLTVMFDLCFVALDPFTHESAWILESAGRILTNFDEADVRVAFLCTATPEECRLFLGPWARNVLTFADPDRTTVKGFGIDRLPALVHLATTGEIAGVCEGWDPACWRSVTDSLARRMSWLAPVVPGPADPAPFEGTPALG